MTIRAPQQTPLLSNRSLFFRLGAGLVLAMSLVWAYRSYGFAAYPAILVVLLAVGHTARTTLENRSLRKQMKAVEALGRSVAAGQREDVPLNRFLALARELVS